jgi:hypothetical protein
MNANSPTVAERMRAPLYKIELHTSGIFPSYNTDKLKTEIEASFDRAMKWDAVLLIDECDTYLKKRSDSDSVRNRIVAGNCLNFKLIQDGQLLTPQQHFSRIWNITHRSSSSPPTVLTHLISHSNLVWTSR